MVTKNSALVEARRRAEELVRKQYEDQIAAEAEAAAEVMVNEEARLAAEAALAAAERAERAAIDRLVDGLGKTTDEVAKMTGLDVSAVRSHRRKSAAEQSAAKPAKAAPAPPPPPAAGPGPSALPPLVPPVRPAPTGDQVPA
jgi:DNA-directed RNA polymerase specialized sigma24 family protein